MSKLMRVGRVTVLLVGMGVILALVFEVASAALEANGDFFTCSRNHRLSHGY